MTILSTVHDLFQMVYDVTDDAERETTTNVYVHTTSSGPKHTRARNVLRVLKLAFSPGQVLLESFSGYPHIMRYHVASRHFRTVCSCSSSQIPPCLTGVVGDKIAEIHSKEHTLVVGSALGAIWGIDFPHHERDPRITDMYFPPRPYSTQALKETDEGILVLSVWLVLSQPLCRAIT